MRQGESQKRFALLDEFLVEDILTASDEQLLAEVAEDFGDARALAAEFDSIVRREEPGRNASPADENLIAPDGNAPTWEPFRKCARILQRGLSLSAEAFVANRTYVFTSAAFACLLLIAIVVVRSQRERDVDAGGMIVVQPHPQDAAQAPAREQPASAAASEAARTWESVQKTADLAVIDQFLRQYGNVPVYGDLARTRREELTTALAASSSTAGDAGTCRTGAGGDAIAACSRVLASNPNDAAANGHRGRAYIAEGDYDRAIADFDQAIRLDPALAESYSDRGYAYGLRDKPGDRDRAMADLGKGIALAPNLGRSYAYRAAIYELRGDPDRAMADARQAIALDPKDAFAYNVRGMVYFGKGEYDRAIADYDQALKLDPSLADARQNRERAQAASVSSQTRPGGGVLVWHIKSNYKYKVQISFYSQDRSVEWPGNGQAWGLNDYSTHEYTMRCRLGEKICFGAWVTGDSSIYWGVGADNSHSCSNCCFVCGNGETAVQVIGE